MAFIVHPLRGQWPVDKAMSGVWVETSASWLGKVDKNVELKFGRRGYCVADGSCNTPCSRATMGYEFMYIIQGLCWYTEEAFEHLHHIVSITSIFHEEILCTTEFLLRLKMTFTRWNIYISLPIYHSSFPLVNLNIVWIKFKIYKSLHRQHLGKPDPEIIVD